MTITAEGSINLSDLDVKNWRIRFKEAHTAYKSKCADKLHISLAEVDSHYTTAEGYRELSNVLIERAGIMVVARATQALERFLKSREQKIESLFEAK